MMLKKNESEHLKREIIQYNNINTVSVYTYILFDK